MKKIMLGIVTILAVFIFLFGESITGNKEETSEGNKMVMLAPADLDVSQISKEDMAILIEQGWDFSGEVPSLTIREEDVDYEVIDGVVDLGELFDAMDQNVSETE